MDGRKSLQPAPCAEAFFSLFLMAMLCIDIRKLEAQAQSIDSMLNSLDPVWQEGDVVPENPGAHVTGRLSQAGGGRFYFSGRLSGKALVSCRRCLTEVLADVSGDLSFLFAESDLDEAQEDDVIPIPSGEWEIDLRPVVREEWLLSVPSYALCQDNCLGLCPSCGVDRNRETCSCLPSTDPRWESLRAFRGSDS